MTGRVIESWQEPFFRLVAQGTPMSAAAAAVKVGLDRIYSKRDSDAVFCTRLKVATEKSSHISMKGKSGQ